jgi:GNAT superfamily N-acetyltransferase
LINMQNKVAESEVIVRPLHIEDREDFLAMSKAFFNSDAVAHKVEDVYHERTFAELMRSSEYTECYMICIADQSVGYALTAKTWSREAGGLTVWLEELFILPEWRGHGLGATFLSRWLNRVEKKEKDIYRLRLEVEPENRDAMRLYRRQGFERLGYDAWVKELPH